MQITTPLYFVHKYSEQQCYGGPEEGGWWYDAGDPVPEWTPLVFTDEEEAYAKCRELHLIEYERRDTEKISYTSVLSYRDEFYVYDISSSSEPKSYPERIPHYE